MNPWLELCRGAAGDIRAVLAKLPTRVEREPVTKIGEGGDDTTAIDAAAELAVLRRLERLDESFTLVSEELGEDGADVGGRGAADLEPRTHRGWKSRPVISFGKKYVVFCGSTSPRRA